jgi:hypothetical protein
MVDRKKLTEFKRPSPTRRREPAGSSSPLAGRSRTAGSSSPLAGRRQRCSPCLRQSGQEPHAYFSSLLASAEVGKSLTPSSLLSAPAPKSKVTSHAQPHAALMIQTSIYRGNVGRGEKSLILFAACLEKSQKRYTVQMH